MEFEQSKQNSWITSVKKGLDQAAIDEETVNLCAILNCHSERKVSILTRVIWHLIFSVASDMTWVGITHTVIRGTVGRILLVLNYVYFLQPWSGIMKHPDA